MAVNTSAELLTFFLLIEVETEFFTELNKSYHYLYSLTGREIATYTSFIPNNFKLLKKSLYILMKGLLKIRYLCYKMLIGI